jgi:hypothetical protein
MRHIKRWLTVTLVCCLFAPANGQQLYTQDLNFASAGQNIWGPGAQQGAFFDYSRTASSQNPQFPGDDTIGSFSSFLGLESGAGLKFRGAASIGLNVHAYARAGSVDVTYPLTITLTYPDNGVLYPGDTYAISAAFVPDIGTTMTTTSPSAGFKAEVPLSIQAHLSAEVELANSDLFNDTILDIPPLSQTIPLLDTDDPIFRALVSFAGSFALSYATQNVITGKFHDPVINTTGTLQSDHSLTSSGSDRFLALKGDITNLIFLLLDLPAVNRDISVAGGDLHAGFHFLDLSEDNDFALFQRFQFMPRPAITLQLSTGQSVTLHAGETITLTMPAVGSGAASDGVTLTPTFALDNTFSNTTGITFAPGLNFNPLEISGGVDVGPVSFGIDFKPLSGPFNLWEDAFDVNIFPNLLFPNNSWTLGGFSPVTTAPFRINGYVYPLPTLTSVSPVMVKQGSGAFTLNATGANFVAPHTGSGSGVVIPGTTLQWDGANRATADSPPTSASAGISANDTGAEGIHTITAFNSAPGGGLSSPQKVIVDGTAPVTAGQLTATPQGSHGWFRGPVTVALSVTDNLSGVASTLTSVDGSSSLFTAPNNIPAFGIGPNPVPVPTFVIAGDGSHTLTYASTDNVGNAEGTNSQTVKIDTVAPAMTSSANQTQLWPPNGKMVPVVVSGKVTDSGSGVDLSSGAYAVSDSEGTVQPSGAFSINADGTYSVTILLQSSRLGTIRSGRKYTITLTASDNAGNPTTSAVIVTVPHDQGN